ncbi:hypothetical protein T484DRAFT_1831710 [Baffinella frigidus]|nr:hypothetical protein T484DRAFT_1831710 [Cryptophyta sp. CCMP2293]
MTRLRGCAAALLALVCLFCVATEAGPRSPARAAPLLASRSGWSTPIEASPQLRGRNLHHINRIVPPGTRTHLGLRGAGPAPAARGGSTALDRATLLAACAEFVSSPAGAECAWGADELLGLVSASPHSGLRRDLE